MSNQKYCVYTDGACSNNGKKNAVGAIGVFFYENDNDNLSQVIENDGSKITNQTMELLAVIQALKIIGDKIANKTITQSIIYIYTDSTYVINSMTKWYSNWEKNNWLNAKNKPVENKELIQVLYSLKSKYIVIFKHVNSHQKEPEDKESDEHKAWYGNFMADSLATNACKQFIKVREKQDEEKEKESLDDIKVKCKKINKKKVQDALNV
jgi:ribonuclease HI